MLASSNLQKAYYSRLDPLASCLLYILPIQTMQFFPILFGAARPSLAAGAIHKENVKMSQDLTTAIQYILRYQSDSTKLSVAVRTLPPPG